MRLMTVWRITEKIIRIAINVKYAQLLSDPRAPARVGIDTIRSRYSLSIYLQQTFMQ